jgi:serine/threonine-protein kinase
MPSYYFEIPNPSPDLAAFSVSPDGQHFAYYAPVEDGKGAIWIRSIHSFSARALPGTDGATQPDWSADSRSLAIVIQGRLHKIQIDGGPPEFLTSLQAGIVNRGTWNREGVILVANQIIRQVSASDGTISDATELAKGETTHVTPWFLPDDRHFLYVARGVDPSNNALFVGELGSKSKKRLMAAESKSIYSAGFLLYARSRTLLARPFDLAKLEFTGDPVKVVDDIAHDPSTGVAAFGASSNGTLVYRRGDLNFGGRVLRRRDRKGNDLMTPVPILGTIIGGVEWDVQLSPDDRLVAFHNTYDDRTYLGNADVRIHDLKQALSVRVTTEPVDDTHPVWSPGNDRLVYARQINPGKPDTAIYERRADRAAPERLLLPAEPGIAIFARDWSEKANTIVFERINAGGAADIWTLPLDKGGKLRPYLETASDERQPSLSPNGRYIAYVTNESGTSHVVVQSYPDPKDSRQVVSAAGGLYPRWSHDGRELFYVDSEGQLIAVAVRTDGEFVIEKSTPLFATGLLRSATAFTSISYDVSRNGQEFLIMTPPDATSALPSAPISVITNWPSLIRQ